MKALVTGAEGFVGPHLISFLEKQGLQTFGTSMHPDESNENFYAMDVTKRKEVFDVLGKIRPDYIFHLAGFSSVKESFDKPELCKKVNVEGTRNILDAVLENNLKTNILVVSSAEVYGKPESIPITEEHPVVARTPYGESRLQQEALCREYVQKNGLFIITTRSFNHTGPGQQDTFVIPSFAKQVVLIENGKKDCIKVGNLEAVRDFSDVRDIVQAYYLLLKKGKQGEVYNVCSGKGFEIRELLQKLIGLSSTEIRVEQDPERMRPADIPRLIGDNTKLKEDTGWEPAIRIESTLKDTLDFWRKQIKQSQ